MGGAEGVSSFNGHLVYSLTSLKAIAKARSF